MALRVAVLGLRERRLGHDGTEPGVVGGVGEGGELLLDHRQLLAGACQPPVDLGEAALDDLARHSR